MCPIKVSEAKARYHVTLLSVGGTPLEGVDGDGDPKMSSIQFDTNNVFNLDPKYKSCLVFLKQLIIDPKGAGAGDGAIDSAYSIYLRTGTLMNNLEIGRTQQGTGNVNINNNTQLLARIPNATSTADPQNFVFAGNAKDNGKFCGSPLVNGSFILEFRNGAGFLLNEFGNYSVSLEIEMVEND